MQSTYENIIGVSTPRACIFCGGFARVRHVDLSKTNQLLQNVDLQCQNTVMTTFRNVYDACIQWQDLHNIHEHLITSCVPCSHWLQPHTENSKASIPIYYMQQYIRTIQTTDTLSFDRRTIWRLAKILTQSYNDKVNFFLTLFTPREQALLARISVEGTTTIFQNITLHFNETHGAMMFAPNRQTSEFLRDTLANKEEIKPHSSGKKSIVTTPLPRSIELLSLPELDESSSMSAIPTLKSFSSSLASSSDVDLLSVSEPSIKDDKS